MTMTAPGNSLTASTRASRLSMSRWLVGSSRIRSCGASRHIRASARRVFSPPERWRAWVRAWSWPRPKRASQARVACSRSAGRRTWTCWIGVSLGLEVLDLVLGEEADLEPARAGQLARHRLQPAGDQLGEGRLAVAVAAEEGDAVVGVEAQGQLGQHHLVAIAGLGPLHGDHRRGGDRRGREGEADLGLDQGLRDRLHALEHLDPALRLAGLARLVAEAVDEGLDVGALGQSAARAPSRPAPGARGGCARTGRSRRSRG